MKKIIKYLLAKAGYSMHCIRHIPDSLLNPNHVRNFNFEDAANILMHQKGSKLVFLQIGVYDGLYGDPLRKFILQYGWGGVMVEPQHKCAAGLRDLYSTNKDIQVLQAAVDIEPGERILYTIEESEATDWKGGLASFSRETITKHEKFFPGISSKILEQKVPCLTPAMVLEKIPGGYLDILQIDTEGADGMIISLFPFERICPAIVHFEIKHLSKSEQEKSFARLIGYGYKLSKPVDDDILAVKI
jgi:hypothetical protein